MGNVQMEADQIRYKDSSGTYRNVQTGLAAAIAGGGGGSSTLAGLTDTDITTPSNGQVLTYDSTAEKWENAAIPAQSIDGLSDTAITTPSDGQVLTYDATAEKWVNASGVSEAGIEALIDSTVGWTGKNLLQNLGTSQEINNVVFTIYDDGSVKAHGTASANATLHLTSKALNAGFLSSLSGKSVILSGGHSDNKRVQMWSTNGGVVYSGTGEIAIDVTSSIASSADYNIVINILQGQVCDNEMFYPMIRDARITDSTYEPYHKSVEACLDEIKVKSATFSGTTSASGNVVIDAAKCIKVLSAFCDTIVDDSALFAVPLYPSATSTSLHLMKAVGSTAVASAEVSGIYYYID